ncbi:hypothetical protein [Pseudonocardia humida]|uniref:Uncharacterized protein n=1 Tax=Pseudonocardia humida TaxID=2800819 RepID=A0ABT1A8V7_9PSEU|nr:hypothetical protein [Pseudonocardia humida]MCO1659104.1 hypothetical protein [Pseudonocardia humida]
MHRVLDRDLRLLSLEELREAVAMPLFSVEPGATVVYHALFQDVAILPWARPRWSDSDPDSDSDSDGP